MQVYHDLTNFDFSICFWAAGRITQESISLKKDIRFYWLGLVIIALKFNHLVL